MESSSVDHTAALKIPMDEIVSVNKAVAQTKRTVVWSVAIVLAAMLIGDLLVILMVDWARSLPRTALVVGTPAWWTQRVAYAISFGLLMGMFTSQLLLAAAYSALGDGPSPRRIIYTTFVVAIFTNSLVVFGMWWFQRAWSESVFPFLIATLFFFVFQIPMWGVRSCFSWTIKSPWSDLVSQRPMRFSLAHLLGWSAFLAVPLCIFPALTLTGSRGYFPSIFWIWALILCVLLLWFVYVALAADIGKSQVVATAALSLLVAVAMQYEAFRFWDGPASFVTVLIISIANFFGGAVLLFCLRLAHRLGFRLLPFEAKRFVPQASQETKRLSP